MKRVFYVAMLLLWAGSLTAAIPEGYYSALEGKCSVALRNAAGATAKGHKRITYSSGTWDAFEKTDVKLVNGKRAWWDMYSNNIVYLPGHNGLNIEHSVAQSWWGGGHSNDQGCDLFHLNPSESDANNRKANYPLGEIAGSPSWTNGVTNVGNPVPGQGGGSSKVYEPADEYKGDFARAFMYVFTVYNNISWASKCAWMYDTANTLLLKQWAIELLLRWSDNDPVDEKEYKRNEEVYKIQGNRNPFIDHPELGHYIWGSKNETPWYPSESGVETIESEQAVVVTGGEISAPADSRVFNLCGKEVGMHPGKGIYIVVTPSGKSSKIVVK
ncbi:MAG: endonuclease [Muribaculaceae bacterium]|nr:endonuclease [Muribaculaceae bacterium]